MNDKQILLWRSKLLSGEYTKPLIKKGQLYTGSGYLQ